MEDILTGRLDRVANASCNAIRARVMVLTSSSYHWSGSRGIALPARLVPSPTWLSRSDSSLARGCVPLWTLFRLDGRRFASRGIGYGAALGPYGAAPPPYDSRCTVDFA